MIPIDSKKRSKTFWALTVIILCGLYYLLTLLDKYVLFTPWMTWDPGGSLADWLLQTPLQSISAHVRLLFLYIPMLLLIFLTATSFPYLFRRYWLRITLTFAFIATLTDRIDFLILWYRFYTQCRFPAIGFTAITLSLFASPLAGSYLTARFLIKIPLDPMACKKCGYLLYGLNINRCPECGNEFDAQLLDTNRETPDTPAS